MKEIERPEMQKENQVSVLITGAKEEGWSGSASSIQQLQVSLPYLKPWGHDMFHSSQHFGKR